MDNDRKEQLDLIIENRIREEYKKYSKYDHMDWVKIAAIKVRAEIEHFNKLHPEVPSGNKDITIAVGEDEVYESARMFRDWFYKNMSEQQNPVFAGFIAGYKAAADKLYTLEEIKAIIPKAIKSYFLSPVASNSTNMQAEWYNENQLEKDLQSIRKSKEDENKTD